MPGTVPRRPRWSLARFRATRLLPPVLTAAVLTVAVGLRWRAEVGKPEFEFRDGRRDRVVRVVDGESFLLEGNVRVRLIGVDAPDPGEPGGDEATEFLRDLVAGREVELRFDLERIGRDESVLAYALVDDVCANEAIIAAGHARMRRGEPFSATWQRRFKKAEESAPSR